METFNQEASRTTLKGYQWYIKGYKRKASHCKTQMLKIQCTVQLTACTSLLSDSYLQRKWLKSQPLTWLLWPVFFWHPSFGNEQRLLWQTNAWRRKRYTTSLQTLKGSGTKYSASLFLHFDPLLLTVINSCQHGWNILNNLTFIVLSFKYKVHGSTILEWK